MLTRRVVLRKRGRRATFIRATEEPTDMKTLQAETTREAVSLSMVAPASSNIVTGRHSEAEYLYQSVFNRNNIIMQ